MTNDDSDPVSFEPHVLREYALVADGERGGLIGPHGELTWMCAPRWDSEAVFSELVGGQGVYSVTPADPRHVWGGYYEAGNLIWCSRRVTGDSVIECREVLAFPGDPDRVVLLRQISAVQGDARVRVVLEPRAGFGRHGSHRVSLNDAIWSGTSGPLRWRWEGGGQGRPRPVAHGRGELLRLELTVPAGGRHDLVLEIADGALGRRSAGSGRDLAGHRSGLGPGPAAAAAGHRPARRPARLGGAARLDRLGANGQKAAQAAADAIARRWAEPDAGIWELDDRLWTHSRLACVAGLRAVAALPSTGTGSGDCAALADAIMAETARTSAHPDGYWQRGPDDERPDAALLLPPVRGAMPAADPRTVATLRVVRDQLAREEYVFRFRHDQRPLGDPEGAFLLCRFIMALAEHQQGHELAAIRYFERNRAACGPPGLLSEEYDVTQRQLRGNLPQAFVHALLLECAATLTGPRADAG